MLDRLGHSVLIPSKDWKVTHYPDPPVQRWVWDTSRDDSWVKSNYGQNVSAVSKEECLDLTPDALWITNFESQGEILKEVAAKLPKAKIIYFSGNDYWINCYPLAQNYIYSDQTAKEHCRINKTPNSSQWIPFIHSDEPFKVSLPNPVQLTSFINGYSRHFNREFLFFNRLKEVNPEVQIENIEEHPREFVRKRMEETTFGLGIKGKEGLGYSNIELASLGRPSILHKDCCQNKSLLSWMLPNQTALYFNDGREFRDIVEAAMFCPEWVEGFQKTCYRRIRELVNTEKEIETLRKFLENLV